MGKHNGKARSQGGTKVGSALTKRHKIGGGGNFGGRHTTDMGGGMQSILERNDLDELMAMAELADRDFTAERYQPVVVGSSAHGTLAAEQSAALRAEAEARAAALLVIPRRPAWDASTTAEQLDAQEKAAFLDWRRALAVVEEEEGLMLTPFERNLEVWRQLWRVLERSDIVVQVVDARDPLTYFSTDLAAYARELHATKASFVLLNKADLLPEEVRAAWADHFEAAGVRYGFWSAFAASEAQARARHDALAVGEVAPSSAAVLEHFYALLGLPAAAAVAGAGAGAGAVGGRGRTRILSVEELLELLEGLARDAVAAAGDDDPRRADPGRRVVVGLVGYPNVGKSSTINAIFGAKKTAVAPTPGKTKHFQTLNVSPTCCLCDCPGLVFPRFAASKAEMVAAGVISLDRLTDTRAPIEVVAARVARPQLEAVYGAALGPGFDAGRDAAAPDAPAALSPGTLLLRALARARGWAASAGLPDEAAAGLRRGARLGADSRAAAGQRQRHAPRAGLAAAARRGRGDGGGAAARGAAPGGGGSSGGGSSSSSSDDSDGSSSSDDDGSSSDNGGGGAAAGASGEAAGAPPAGALLLSDADLELLEGLGEGPRAKAKRAEHKFHKKAPRTKGTRGLAADAGGYDGAALSTGKKGGLVRVGGY
ncbi:LSG1-2 [Scenedesmus sp. PABB004]|nr:LSG1-2 [Scenedesmus sp. PABB004]